MYNKKVKYLDIVVISATFNLCYECIILVILSHDNEER